MTIRVIAAISDLFLRSRILEVAKSIGGDALFANNPEELKKLVTQDPAQLVVLDLSSTDYDPFSLAHELKTLSSARLFGFFPHVRTDLKSKANSAGFEYVIPNSNFVASLRRVLLEGAEDD